MLKKESSTIFPLLLAICSALQFAIPFTTLLQPLLAVPAQAQTKTVNVSSSRASNNARQSLSTYGQRTENTVPGQYDDAVPKMYSVDEASRINQETVNRRVDALLTQHGAPRVFTSSTAPNNEMQAGYTSLAWQAAEQGQDRSMRDSANDILNTSLAAVNDTTRGMTAFWNDTIVGKFFHNIGQLVAKELNEWINGWVADAAQFLARALATFVLNPNVAVNGLDGSHDDGISKYVRQAADVLYGIAVDLLLLLFILCIWKYWADASWKGAGNLMGPVGRLIFTAGLLLAWPTIYAFEIQISNEMIRAISANTPDQILMLDFALAQAIKGGLIALGAGATSVFAPVLTQIPVAGAALVGNFFSFASTLIFTILAAVLITQLVYIIVLKAVQTALLTAQYMFAPIFLVMFATPDTEEYATNYVKAFVETSLWTFVWVGLLKLLSIMLFSNFNPWGKILIVIGILQLMIEVPTFMSKAKISPASDFVTPALAIGAVNKGMESLRAMTGTAAEAFFSTGGSGGNGGGKGGGGGGGAGGGSPASPNPNAPNPNGTTLSHSLNHASASNNNSPLSTQGLLRALTSGPSPGLTPPTANNDNNKDKNTKAQTSSAAEAAAKAKGDFNSLRTATVDTSKAEKSVSGQLQSSMGPPSSSSVKASSKPISVVGPSTIKTSLNTRPIHANDNENLVQEVPNLETSNTNSTGANLVHANDNVGKTLNQHGKNDAEKLVPSDIARSMVSKLSSVEGMSMRLGQRNTSIIGSTARGVRRIHIAHGASEKDTALAVYAAAFANNVQSCDIAQDAARASVIGDSLTEPAKMVANMGANWAGNTRSTWNSAPKAKQHFQHAMWEAAVTGSQAYVSRQQGNAYTAYLQEEFGNWNDAHEVEAIQFVSSQNSMASPLNSNRIGAANSAIYGNGFPVNRDDTNLAMQNVALTNMHPARRKQAVQAMLTYTYPQAKELYGDPSRVEFQAAHGEMARSMSPAEVDQVLTVYQLGGQSELNSPMAGNYISAAAHVAAETNQDFATAYTCVRRAAFHVARNNGYISRDADISSLNSYSDLISQFGPNNGGSQEASMKAILDRAQNSLLDIQSRRMPITVINNADFATGYFSALPMRSV